jgi:hypothetical protein
MLHIRLELTHSRQQDYDRVHQSMNSIGAFRCYYDSQGTFRGLPPGEYRVQYRSDVTIDNIESKIRAALWWIDVCDIHIEAEEIGRSIGFNLRKSSIGAALSALASKNPYGSLFFKS